MYAVDGARRLPERTLEHLPGYAGSRPVRIGNGAVGQRQTDVLGEVMIALEHGPARAGVQHDDNAWALQRVLRRRTWPDLAGARPRPLGDPRRAAHGSPTPGRWSGRRSTARCTAVEEYGLPGTGRASGGRSATRSAPRCWSTASTPERNTFTQHYDTTEVDASLLVLPQVGFIDGDDPRMLGTIEAVEQDLMRDGLRAALPHRDRRRRPRRRRAPVPGLLVLAGLGVRRGRPHATTRTRCSTGWSAWSTTSGCCRRSTTPRGGRMVGNFPQAFSHLALVQAAFELADR